MLIALRVILLALFVAAPLGHQDTRTALERLAERYRDDPALIPVTFGVRVGNSDYTVAATRAGEAGEARVTVTRGAPEVPTFIYVTDATTFSRIASGDLQSLTAMTGTDGAGAAPLRLEATNGWDLDAEGLATLRSVSCHFFPAGFAEPLALPEAIAQGGESA